MNVKNVGQENSLSDGVAVFKRPVPRIAYIIYILLICLHSANSLSEVLGVLTQSIDS